MVRSTHQVKRGRWVNDEKRAFAEPRERAATAHAQRCVWAIPAERGAQPEGSRSRGCSARVARTLRDIASEERMPTLGSQSWINHG
jgi:hypothetical protein